MKYNLAQNSYASPNLIQGNKNLTYQQLVDFVIENDVNITLSGSNVFALDLDLGERILADEVRYYFESSSDPSTIVSGVSFYIKRGPSETYSSISSYVGPTYYYATITGSSYAPSNIRLIHTVSGTSVSGIAHALQVINNEDIVNFGAGSDRTSERFDLSLYFDPSDIKELAIYNSGATSADAYITVEPQYGLIDNLLSFGPTASGEWHGVFDEDNKISGPNRWDVQYNYYSIGSQFNNTYVYNNSLMLYYMAASGTYTTCVFGGPDHPAFMPMLLDTDYPVLASGTVFYDDFTTLVGTKWKVATGGASYTNGYLALTATNNDVSIKGTVLYGQDWEVLMKVMWGACFYNLYYPDDGRAVYYPYYVSDSEYVALSVYPNTNNSIRFYMNGTHLHTNTNYVPANEVGNWFWLRAKRDRYNVKYKLWKDGVSEPDWNFTQAINNQTFPSFSSKIRIYTYTTYSPYTNFRLDNVSVYSNCSAIGETNHIVAVDPTDTMETVEIKSTNAKPKDYNVYTTFSGVTTGGFFYIRSYLRYFENDQIRNQKDLWSTQYGSYPVSGYGAMMVLDELDETVWGVTLSTQPGYATANMTLFRWKQLTDAISNVVIFSIGNGTINADVRFIVPNRDQNCWIYYKTTTGTAGYYLKCFNSALTTTLNLFKAQTDFVGGMCLASNIGHLWYSDLQTNTVMKLDTSGNPVCSYLAVDDISHMCSDGYGGCYVLQQAAILRLDTNAQLLYTITGDFNQYVSNICLDKDEPGSFWLIGDSSYIINITHEGRLNFSIYYDHFIEDMKAVSGGVWFKCVDDKRWRFFDRRQKKVTKETETKTSGGVDLFGSTNTPLFFSKPFSESDHDNRFPTVTDTHWQNLSWRKISPKNYLLPADQYHQIRFTLRASTPGNVSPVLNYLYRQNVIKLENIPPMQYKNIYVKADISSLNETQLGHYTSNLRTWWYIPE